MRQGKPLYPECIQNYVHGPVEPDEGQNLSIAIHTLDARNNIMLKMMRDYFKLSPDQMRWEVQGVARATSALLSKKGIDYGALRSALVPQQDRR